MSIVIATLEQNKEVNIFGDRRMVEEDTSGSNYKIHDVQKVFKLSDTILCGMTGDAKWGFKLVNSLLKDGIPSLMVQTIKNFNTPKEPSTFILGGKYDDGDLFLFGYLTEGGEILRKNEDECIIAISPLELTNECSELYLNYKKRGYSNDKCCVEIIKFAASKKSKYISEEFNQFKILNN